MLTVFAASLIWMAGQATPGSAADFEAAKALWVEMGMPTLSKDSKPVLVKLGWWSGAGGDEQLGLGFTHPGGAPDDSFVLGGEVFPRLGQRPARTPADWSVETVAKIGEGGISIREFFQDTNLGAAILSSISGHQEDSAALLKKIRPANDRAIFGSYYLGVTKDDSYQARTAMQIATCYANRLLEPNSDRRQILQSLQKLNRTGLLIPGQVKWGLNDVIGELQATIDGPMRPIGSPEGAVDDLTNANAFELWGSSHEPDPRVERVAGLGLKAVPALIGHLKDQKLTRSFRPAMGNGSPGIIYVGEVAEELLERISKGDLVTHQEHMTKAEATRWYEAAKSEKVDQMLLSSLVDQWRANGETIRRASGAFVAIARHHPYLMRKAYTKVLKAVPTVDTENAARIIDESKLPATEKISLLMLGVNSPKAEDRASALRFLFKYDKEAFDRHLAESLDRLPANGPGGDFWESHLASLTTETNDPKVWNSLSHAIARAKPDFRSALLTMLRSYPGNENRNATLALKVLAQYFDDHSMANRYIRYGGRPETVGHHALEVASDILGYEHHPSDDHRDAKGWEDLRLWVTSRLPIAAK